jgi:hypothetical protein
MISTEISWVTDRWRPTAHALRQLSTLLTPEQIDFAFAHLPSRLRPEHEARYEVLRQELGDWSLARAHVWLERIGWSDEPPQGLFDAVERMVEEAREVGDAADGSIRRLRRELEKCRFTLTEDPTILITPMGQDLSVPATATGVGLALERLDRTLWGDGDAHGALGYAKDLIEATAKFVLIELRIAFDSKSDAPSLVAKAQASLGHWAADQTDVLLRDLCGNASKQAQLIIQLRNRTAGAVGHGSAISDGLLQPFHARLVMDAAIAWARFMLAALSRAGAKSQAGQEIATETSA